MVWRAEQWNEKTEVVCCSIVSTTDPNACKDGDDNERHENDISSELGSSLSESSDVCEMSQ